MGALSVEEDLQNQSKANQTKRKNPKKLVPNTYVFHLKFQNITENPNRFPEKVKCINQD